MHGRFTRLGVRTALVIALLATLTVAGAGGAVADSAADDASVTANDDVCVYAEYPYPERNHYFYHLEERTLEYCPTGT